MNFAELYFSLNGRIGRKTYLLWLVLPWLVLTIAAALLDEALGIQVISGLVGLLTLWPQIAMAAKRLHDRDRSAWFLLIWLVGAAGSVGLALDIAVLHTGWLGLTCVPLLLAGLWLVIELWFLRGTSGDNRFGSDPLAGGGGSAAASLGLTLIGTGVNAVVRDGRESVIGRSREADIVINDDTVSRRHAVIFCQNGSGWISDLGSTNGTMVDGQGIEPGQRMAIARGTAIRLGDLALTVV